MFNRSSRANEHVDRGCPPQVMGSFSGKTLQNETVLLSFDPCFRSHGIDYK